LVQKNRATAKLDSNGFSRNENLQRKQKRTAKSANLKENAGKIKSSEQPWETKILGIALNIAGVERIRSQTWGCGQHWRPFDSSFE